MRVGPVALTVVSNVLTSKRVALSVAAVLAFPLLWWLVTLGRFPLLLFCGAVAMSSVTFIMYGLDKWAAKRDAQRTPENTLQFCALVGGWPGALLAQQIFRHKSSKRSYQVVFWSMVMINCGVLGFLLSPRGTALIRQLLEVR